VKVISGTTDGFIVVPQKQYMYEVSYNGRTSLCEQLFLLLNSIERTYVYNARATY